MDLSRCPGHAVPRALSFLGRRGAVLVLHLPCAAQELRPESAVLCQPPQLLLGRLLASLGPSPTASQGKQRAWRWELPQAPGMRFPHGKAAAAPDILNLQVPGLHLPRSLDLGPGGSMRGLRGSL